MKPAPAVAGANRCSTGLQRSRALLILIAGLLNACGNSAGEAGTSGVSPATCVTGPGPTLLTWDAVAGATGYRIYYSAAGTNSQFVDVPGSLTTSVVTGLTIGETYYFVATTLSGSSESSFSNVVCKTIS